MLHKCVICSKLRRPSAHKSWLTYKQTELIRHLCFLFKESTFFGWRNIVSYRTQRGLAHSKRWPVLFSCLTSRAIHIEVTFINALTRFIPIRGSVKEFRSDPGTNAIGALDHIYDDAINMLSLVQLKKNDVHKWSQMAGSW